MKTILRRLRAAVSTWRQKDAFVKPVTTLASGTTAAYLLTYAARPIITRLFTAEAFGLFTFFIAVLTVVSTVASGRYVDALMLPKTQAKALNLLVLAGGLVTITALCTGLLIPWREELARYSGHADLAPWFLLLPPAVAAAGWIQLVETWHTRTNKFRIISSARFLRSGSTAGLQVGGGLVGYGTGALIGGHVTGSLVAAGFLGSFILVKHHRALRQSVRWCHLWEQAVRYRRFLQYSTPAALLNNAIARLPVLLLLFYFSSEVVGLFGITYGTLAVPLGLVTGAIGQIFFVRAAEALPAQELPDVTTRVHRRLVAIGLFPTFAAIAAGPELFSFVFGSDWRMAGVFAQYLAPWIFLSSVASPLTRLFDVLERQRADLAFSILMFIVLAATLVLGGTIGTAVQTICAFGVAGALVRITHILLMLHLTDVSWRILPRHLGRYSLISIPFLGIVGLAANTTGNATIFIVTLLTGLVYLGAVAGDDIVNFPAEGTDPHRPS